MQVWILKLGREAVVVVGNFRNAIRHAAAAFFPDKEERHSARQMLAFPLLHDIGAAGSFSHFLRYHNELNDNLPFAIEEHRTGGPPGHPSIVLSIDCNGGTDPSYSLQRAIWQLASGRDRRQPVSIAAELESNVGEALARLRSRSPDREGIDLLRDLTARFDGPDVIPQFGSVSRILDLVPGKCRTAFLEVAGALPPTQRQAAGSD